MSETYDLFQLGRARLRGGMAAQATVPLERAKRLEPDKASIREALGIAYFRIARWEEAAAEFSAILELSPTDDYAHYALGRSLEKLGRRAEAEAQGRELLEQVRIPEQADKYPGQLSGGQQQRVAIARALAMRPKVLLFDEPTSALDPELIGEVLKVMEDLAHEGTTMIVVTHEMHFARQAADRVVFMEDGVVVEQGPPEQMLDEPRKEGTKRFLRRFLTP